MTVRMVAHPTLSDARRRQAAVDVADGYPRQASARGRRCGRAPEGQTLNSMSISKNTRTLEYHTRLKPSLEGQQVMVSGQRVTITDAGSVDVDQTELTRDLS